MMFVTLPIICYDEETEQLEKLGIYYDLNEAMIVDTTFFHINAVGPYHENNNEYSYIHSNGTVAICTLPYKDVLEIIGKSIGVGVKLSEL